MAAREHAARTAMVERVKVPVSAAMAPVSSLRHRPVVAVAAADTAAAVAVASRVLASEAEVEVEVPLVRVPPERRPRTRRATILPLGRADRSPSRTTK